MTNDMVPVPPQAERQMVRQELAATEIAPLRDAVAVALAEQSRAEVEARIAAARRWPRSIMRVRERLLADCQRPRFAETARYSKPIGGGESVEGWSVRFAEACAAALGNLHSGSVIVIDNDDARVVKVYACDLESNTYRDDVISFKKTVERKHMKPGQAVIRTRINSSGRAVHLVEATDDEVMVKQAALVSKAWRNLIIKLTPADVLEECLDQYAATMEGKGGDVAARVKRVVDGFARIGVKTAAIEEWLGHALDAATHDELTRLIAVGIAIKEGDSTWAASLAARNEERNPAPPAKSAEPAPVGLAAKVAARRAAREPQHDPTTGETVPEPGTEG